MVRRKPIELTWRIVEQGDTVVVEFNGEMDERAELAELREKLEGKATFDLAGVRRIDSCGVREWVRFVGELPAIDLTLTRCSPAVVTQLNLIHNFRGGAKITSFFAPYVCNHCNLEDEKLVEIGGRRAELEAGEMPFFACDGCGRSMEFDEIAERYLSFLRDL